LTDKKIFLYLVEKGNVMTIAVINRGISGSGKSTFNRILKAVAEEAGFTVACHSTDEYFMVDGEYKFEQKKLGYFHGLNKGAFTKSLMDGVDIVICDNTNLRQREYNPYVKAARDNGSAVVAVVFYPDDYDKHVERNAHGVPEDVILRMMGTFSVNNATIGVDKEFCVFPEKFSEKKLQTVSTRIIEEYVRQGKGG